MFEALRIHQRQEWIRLGGRVHGGFGSYIALGIRIGLDAMQRLDAQQRDLKVTYQDGQNSPCPCVVDGIMIATVATPGQNSLQVLSNAKDSNIFGMATIEHKKTGKSLRYVIPSSTRSLLDRWNQDLNERQRYDMEYSLVGFGGGPRFCLGYAFAQMEMKIFASLLLRNYRWEILPNQNLTPEAIPTLHPRSGLKVKFASSIV